MKPLSPFDKMPTKVAWNETGIECTVMSCGFHDKDVKFREVYGKYLNVPCPECGNIILTEEHAKSLREHAVLVDIINYANAKGKTNNTTTVGEFFVMLNLDHDFKKEFGDISFITLEFFIRSVTIILLAEEMSKHRQEIDKLTNNEEH